MKITPIEFESSRMDEFIDFPWNIYPGHYKWVPPIKDSLKQELSKENLFFRHGNAQAFFCEHNGKILGRILASVDDNLEDGFQMGHFGYFESVNDKEVAAALLHAAEDWLKGKGKKVVHGPINFNIYNGYRIQTHGFGTEPFFGEPRHPEYYQELLTTTGYETHLTWRSLDFHASRLKHLINHTDRQLGSISDSNTFCYRIQDFELSNFDQVLRELHAIIMNTFKHNYGFSQLDIDEFLQIYSLMHFLGDNQLAVKALDDDGRTIGFGYSYIDISHILQKANGQTEAFQPIAENNSGTIVLHTFGIVQEYRQTPIVYEIFKRGFKFCTDRKGETIIGALIKEGRSAYDKLGDPTRTYAIFKKEI